MTIRFNFNSVIKGEEVNGIKKSNLFIIYL